MPLTEICWRYFLAHQDRKQEAWLEEQARRGWRLARPGVFRFAFVRGEPHHEKYRLDFQTLRGAARLEYLGLFRDSGWEFVGQVANRYYFRARPDAFSPEIFSDVESRRDRIRRQMRLGVIVTGGLVYMAAMGATQFVQRYVVQHPASSAVPLLTIVLAGSFACVGAWCLWQLEQAYKRER